ncbi:MAG TPA: Ig-like domain-containing protein, partial [Abditibacteriaceae bacterium]
KFPTLANGRYAVQAVARDGSGNETFTAWTPFVIDTVAPTIALVSPKADYSYTKLASASGRTADATGVASVKALLFRYSDSLYWNGTAWTSSLAENAVTGTTTWSYTMPTLADGRYSLQVVARDWAGNARYTAWTPFYIDTTAPSITITTPTQNATYSSLASATGTATDTGPGVAAVRARLQRASDSLYWNGSVWSTTRTDVLAQGTSNWTFALPTLSAGRYSIQILANDLVGNTTYSAPVDFSIGNISARTTTSGTTTTTALSYGEIAAPSVIRLYFRGALDAASASAYENYTVTVDGVPIAPESIACAASSGVVTITLPERSLQSGSQVEVSWSHLYDASGRALADGRWRGSAKTS